MLKQQNLRVLHVLSNLGVGGAEKWVLALLEHFARKSTDFPKPVQLDLFLTHGITDVFDERAKEFGARIYYSRTALPNMFGFVRDWRRALRIGAYHAVHDHEEFLSGIHYGLGYGLLPPVRITHLHNAIVHRDHYASSMRRRFMVTVGNNLIAREATHVLSTSTQLLCEQGYSNNPLYARQKRGVFYCAFDLAPFRQSKCNAKERLCQEFAFPLNSKIVIFVGRLGSHPDPTKDQKNPIFALEIARIAIRKDPGLRFLIVGGVASVKDRLASLVASWGLSGKIILAGLRHDVPDLMVGADASLLTSRAEGLGMVIVEAQAAGVPCIVSANVPDESEVVSGMVEFIDLAKGPEVWAMRLIARLRKPLVSHSECLRLLERSKFNIAVSAQELYRIYSGQVSNVISENDVEQVPSPFFGREAS